MTRLDFVVAAPALDGSQPAPARAIDTAFGGVVAQVRPMLQDARDRTRCDGTPSGLFREWVAGVGPGGPAADPRRGGAVLRC